jgi:putative transposase
VGTPRFSGERKSDKAVALTLENVCAKHHGVKLTAQLKLQPTPEQHAVLKTTLEEANTACNWISQEAFREKVFRRFSLHKLVYHPARERFNLSAQMVVRAIAKVANGYKLSKKKQRGFRQHGAIPYDSRILSFHLARREVSIWTVEGRQPVPFLCSARAFERLQGDRGEADLCFVRGAFYLFVACEVKTPETMDVAGVLGVDLGLVNVATDSDGDRYSGARVASIRSRRHRQRKRLQAKGTKSARRVLKRLSGRENRFMTNVNHTISRQLVENAQRTHWAIALEDLGGIRDRIRVRRRQRRKLHGWAFHQLGQFIQYKAELAGVPVVFVDPAYTSQSCSCCGYVAKSNRPSQATFLCVVCGFSAHADTNAAKNISVLGWAACNSAVQLAPS